MRDGMISRPTFIVTAGAAALACALPARTDSSPFQNVDWEEELRQQSHVLTSACGVDSERACYGIGDGPEAWPGGYPNLDAVAIGKDRATGRWLAAVPLLCGCSSGATTVAVFAEIASRPKLVGAIRQGDRQSPFFANGTLHITTPHRLAADPLCDGYKTICTYAVTTSTITKVSSTVMATAHFAGSRNVRRSYGPHSSREQQTTLSVLS